MEKGQIYEVFLNNQTMWITLNNEWLSTFHKIQEEQVDILHSLVNLHPEAPFGKIIVLPESFSGTPLEMGVVEHECGHILAGHSVMTEDEAQILREIEADSYIHEPQVAVTILCNLMMVTGSKEWRALPNAEFLTECARRRFAAFGERLFNSSLKE